MAKRKEETLKKLRKPRGRVVESSEKKELGIESEGLKLSWIVFLNEYIANGGNGQEAYRKAYPNASKETARVEAVRLLANPNVQAELKHKLSASKITEEYIQERLLTLVDNNLDGKNGFISVKALEILGKMKGMLVDTKRIAFTGENPAVFMPLYSPEDKKKFEKDQENNSRIIE